MIPSVSAEKYTEILDCGDFMVTLKAQCQHFSTRQCKTTFWSYYKGMAEVALTRPQTVEKFETKKKKIIQGNLILLDTLR